MARTGRPPTPIEQKRKLGTLRPDRLPGGTTDLAVVAALEPTMADQSPLEAFDRILHMGVSWLADTDAPTVALLRSSLVELDEMIGQGGYDRKARRDLEKQIFDLLSALGFNPAARSRLGLAEVKAQSKLEEIRERQAKRAAMAAKVAHKADAG
jgi:hypothetical protein